MPSLTAPLLVAHCDWSKDAAKRWVAVGKVDADGRVSAGASEPVGDATTLVDRLHARAGDAKVLVGFDFPIGVPHAYAERAGIGRFRDLLEQLAADERPEFFEPAEQPEDISVRRPFYPMKPGGTSTQQLFDGLGVEDMTTLLRRCERRTATRRAGSSLFWLVGGAQVGKAAIAGWRSVLLPSLRGTSGVGIWPHDGALEDVLRRHGVVLAETYPTEFAAQLDLRLGAEGKRTRTGRAPACRAIEAVSAALGIGFSPSAAADLADDFGDAATGEDRFDAFLGLIGMLNIVLGQRDPGPPTSVPEEVLAVEGWILGQADDGVAPSGSTPAPPARGMKVRIPPEQDRLIRQAAQLVGVPVSSFVVEAAAEKAEQILAAARESGGPPVTPPPAAGPHGR